MSDLRLFLCPLASQWPCRSVTRLPPFLRKTDACLSRGRRELRRFKFVFFHIDRSTYHPALWTLLALFVVFASTVSSCWLQSYGETRCGERRSFLPSTDRFAVGSIYVHRAVTQPLLVSPAW